MTDTAALQLNGFSRAPTYVPYSTPAGAMEAFSRDDAVRAIMSLEERHAQQRSKSYYQVRRHLLQAQIKNRPEASRGTTDRRKVYLQMRHHLLAEKLGITAAEAAMQMVRAYERDPAHGMARSRSSSDSLESVSLSGHMSRATSRDSLASLRSHGEAPYLFQPPQLLIQHSKAICVLRWAHDSKDFLAWGTADGCISMCPQASRESAPQIYTLKGHQLAINDLSFSLSNDLLISASQDATVRIWNTRTRASLRCIQEEGSCIACVLHPSNQCVASPTSTLTLTRNLLLIGCTASAHNLRAVNISTGLGVQSHRLGSGAPVSALRFDQKGTLFAADNTGCIYACKLSHLTGEITALSTFTTSLRAPISSLHVRTIPTLKPEPPELLVSCRDNTIKLLAFQAADNTFRLKRSFQVSSKSTPVRGAFCPLSVPTSALACIVAGSEDCVVYIFSTRERSYVARLQGHTGAVIDVAFSSDESTLATGDATGTLFLWRRVVDDV